MAKAKKNVKEELEEEEEEFEVNAVKKHRRKAGALEYFVSWVGYGDDDDCWVSADNTEGAQIAVNAYWVTLPPKKQADRYEPGTKAHREAVAAATAKKSASKAKTSTSSSNKRASADDAEEDEVKPSKAKKAKAEANGSAKKELKVAARKKRESAALKGEPSPELGDVENGAEAEDELDVPDEVDGKRYFAHEEEYDGVLDWEPLVKEIETIERAEDGELKLFVVWSEDNTYSWVASKLARKRCPQKVIDFYEGHLKFSIKGDDEEMETEE